MKKQQVIEKMCQLVSQVGTEIFQDEIQHDCFCGALKLNDPVVGEQIIEFIEMAILEKLEKTKEK